MTAEEFDMLSENVEDIGFLDPVLVVPKDAKAGAVGKTYGGRFRIVDGEHRYEQQRLGDVPEIRCVVCDPDRMDESEQMKQTVRMNKIRGKMSPTKFASFVEKFMEKADLEPEDIPHELGFVQEDEFEELMEQARKSLPTQEMRDAFDKTKDEIKTVQDLSLVLNRLFTQFGDTLPANFMLLDFGGREHVWIRMEPSIHKMFRSQARQIYGAGYTVDSVIERMIMLLDVDEFIQAHHTFLKPVEEGEEMVPSIEDLLDEEVE